MSTLRVTNVQDTAGANSLTTAQIYNGAAKAWVNFDGTFGTSPFTIANGGIRASFNVSSVTDNGTGDYTVNLATAMVDANHSALVSANFTGTTNVNYLCTLSLSALTASTFRVTANGDNPGTVNDKGIVTVVIFR